MYFLKNEYVDLLPGRSAEIGQRLKHTWLLDEFLLRSDEFNDLRIVTLGLGEKTVGKTTANGVPSARHVQFHPHCHQRAEGISEDGLPTGTSATVELLRSCGYNVELLDTGCCGMAGTFGYEAEHYDLSMKVGELKLFPMLRSRSAYGTSPKSGPGSSQNKEHLNSRFGGGWEGVLSSGAACRMQIRQGTGVEAVHPIVLVANFLKEAENG